MTPFKTPTQIKSTCFKWDIVKKYYTARFFYLQHFAILDFRFARNMARSLEMPKMKFRAKAQPAQIEKVRERQIIYYRPEKTLFNRLLHLGIKGNISLNVVVDRIIKKGVKADKQNNLFDKTI